VLDSGTMGLDLLHFLEGGAAVGGGRRGRAPPPGTVVRLSDGEIPALLGHKLSRTRSGWPTC
jgi:hypothetical protein